MQIMKIKDVINRRDAETWRKTKNIRAVLCALRVSAVK